MTNLGKTKEEVIFELVKSLNMGDSYYARGATNRVTLAEEQYEEMVKRGVIVENEQ